MSAGLSIERCQTVTLSAEQQLLAETVRRFATERVAPLARELDRDQRFPIESWQGAAELGLLGVRAPERHGGAGLGLTELCIVGEELGAVCVSTAATILHQADLVIGRLARHATEQQARRWLPGLCDGSVIGCLAITEPEAGSDAMAMRACATPVDDGFELSGVKTFITNGPVADLALVYAKIGDPSSREIGLFLVPAGTEGFSKGRKLEKMGWRGSPTGELVFERCRLPAEARVGADAEGRAILMSGLDSERVVMAAESVGIVRGCLRAALDYARQRRQFGRAISEFQLIQGKLADLYVSLEAARTLTYAAAAAIERGAGPGTTALASACKLMASEAAARAGAEAVQVLGGYGYTSELPVERYMRDAKLMEIGGGTSEIQRHIIAREMLRRVDADAR